MIDVPAEQQICPQTGEKLFHFRDEITVKLDYLAGDGLRLRVRDDGRGFDQNDANGAGLGLRSMHERAERMKQQLGSSKIDILK